MEGKKYHISFLRMFLLFYLGWSFIIIYTMITSPTLINFIGVSLGGLIPLAIFTAILVIMNPVKINEDGFIVKSQGARTVFTKWEVINWNDIYGIKPTTILFFHYIRIFCKGCAKPIWIPLSVINKSKFIEDLIRYVPDENPLKVFITTGKIKQVSSPTNVEVLVNNKMPESQVDGIYTEETLKAEHALKGGANWFYWIAGLSIINTIILMSGSNWGFLAGLYILQFVDVVAIEIVKNSPEIKTIVMFSSIAFNIIVAGIYVVFGYFSNKKHQWSFILGIVLYALDMLISLAFKDFLSVFIHVIALIGIYNGLKAKFKLNEIEKKKENSFNIQ